MASPEVQVYKLFCTPLGLMLKIPAVLSISWSFSLFRALWGLMFKISGNFEDSSSQHSKFSVVSCMFYFDARVSVFFWKCSALILKFLREGQTWKTALRKAPEQTIRNKTTESKPGTLNKIERRSPTDKGWTSRAPQKQWGTQTTMNKLVENNQENVPETFKTLQKLKNWQRRRRKKRRKSPEKENTHNHKTILCNRKGAELPTPYPLPQVARTIRITKPKSEPRQDQKEIAQRINIKHKGTQEDSRWTSRTYKPHHNHNKRIRFPNRQLLQRNLPDTVARWVF